MLERWTTFGAALLVALVGWLVLGVLPWWSVPVVIVVDAGWSAGRGDLSLVAFLAWAALATAVAAVGAALLL